MAFFRFILANLTNKKIELYGDGSQKRDFTFVSDIVEANIKVLEKNVEGEILNVGGGSVRTIKEILDLICLKTGNENIISFKDTQKGDVLKTESSTENIVKKLNFKPEISVEEGLPMEIRWLESVKEEYIKKLM